MVARIGEFHEELFDLIALVLNAVILIMDLYYAFREISQLIAFGFYEYFISLWNYIDIILILTIMVSVVFDVMSCIQYYTDFESLKVIHAYNIFLLFVRLISYARGIKGTSFMIRSRFVRWAAFKTSLG